MYVGYQCLLVTTRRRADVEAVQPGSDGGRRIRQPVACGAPPPPPPRLGARPPTARGRGGGAGDRRLRPLHGEEGRRLDRQQQRPDLQHDGRRPALDERHQHHRRAANANFNTHRRRASRRQHRLRAGAHRRPGAAALRRASTSTCRSSGARTTAARRGRGSSTGCPSDERTGSRVNVVREDPKQKGLLFAGTETTVYVSFDDGDHWQSLRQNLPSTSIRDLVFHTDDHMNDLVIGTYGRGFWVLDDMSPLREIAAKGAGDRGGAGVFLQAGRRDPRAHQRELGSADRRSSCRTRRTRRTARILYYHLGKPPAGEIKLQIFDAAGRLVRTHVEHSAAADRGRACIPTTGCSRRRRARCRRPSAPTAINWDLRYDDPPAFNRDLKNQMNWSRA